MARPILFCCLFIAAMHRVAAATGDETEKVAGRISASIAQLGVLANSEIKVHSIVACAPIITGGNKWGEIASTTIYYNYGDLFRMNYTVDSTYLGKDSVTNWVAAFNREKYLWYRGDVGQLNYSAKPNQTEPYAMPNPIVANFIFLSQESDECRGCYVSLPSLLSSVTKANEISTKIVGICSDRVEFKSGLVEGSPSIWKVDWPPGSTEAFAPKYVKRCINGRDQVVFEILSYTNIDWSDSAVSLPRAYKLLGFDERNQLIITGLVEVVDIKRNTRTDSGFYSLAELNPQSIFDGDRLHFDKSTTIKVDSAVLRKRQIIRTVVLAALFLTSIGLIAVLFSKKFKGRGVALVPMILLLTVSVSNCSRRSDTVAPKGATPEPVSFSEVGFGGVIFGMKEPEVQRLLGSPDSRSGNAAIYKKSGLTLIYARKSQTVIELLYGSMGLADSVVDTNQYPIRFDGKVALGESPEVVASQLGAPQQQATASTLTTCAYDFPKRLLTLTFSNNKLILISVRTKELPPP